MSEKRKILLYREIMAQCVNNAKEKAGFTKSNPLVGAALVKDGKVISYGVHEFFGGPHAEVNAINSCISDVSETDLLVTLEPCSTSNKTPACTDKIISAGIKNVYIGVIDPNKNHQGQGIIKLKEAGVNVVIGIESEKCALLIEDFTKSITTNKPYVTVKNAISIDGKISSKNNHSKWITCEESRNIVHKMRGETGAILTGIGTILSDNPMMTDRRKEASRQPLRVILDSMAKTPIDSNIIKSAKDYPVIIYVSEKATKDNINKLLDFNVEVIVAPEKENLLDIDFILHSLYSKNIMNVMVEAGATINGSFRDIDEIDKLDVFLAPKIIGSKYSLSSFSGKGVSCIDEAREFVSMDVSKVGKDLHISAKVKDYATDVINSTSNLGEKLKCLQV